MCKRRGGVEHGGRGEFEVGCGLGFGEGWRGVRDDVVDGGFGMRYACLIGGDGRGLLR